MNVTPHQGLMIFSSILMGKSPLFHLLTLDPSCNSHGTHDWINSFLGFHTKNTVMTSRPTVPQYIIQNSLVMGFKESMDYLEHYIKN